MWGVGDGDRAATDSRAIGGTDGDPRRVGRSVRCRLGCTFCVGTGRAECDAPRHDARDFGGTVGGGLADPRRLADWWDAGNDRGGADAEVAGDGAG